MVLNSKFRQLLTQKLKETNTATDSLDNHQETIEIYFLMMNLHVQIDLHLTQQILINLSKPTTVLIRFKNIIDETDTTLPDVILESSYPEFYQTGVNSDKSDARISERRLVDNGIGQGAIQCCPSHCTR